jgi:hypothetical protein
VASRVSQGQVPVTHTCNPNYSGGRDRQDLGSQPASSKEFVRPFLKKPITHKKRAGGVVQGVGPEFKPQYHTHTQRVSQGKAKEPLEQQNYQFWLLKCFLTTQGTCPLPWLYDVMRTPVRLHQVLLDTVLERSSIGVGAVPVERKKIS